MSEEIVKVETSKDIKDETSKKITYYETFENIIDVETVDETNDPWRLLM